MALRLAFLLMLVAIPGIIYSCVSEEEEPVGRQTLDDDDYQPPNGSSDDDDDNDDQADDDDDDDLTDDDTVSDWVLEFDGATGYAQTAGDLSPVFGNAFTVEGWFFIATTSPSARYLLSQMQYSGLSPIAGVSLSQEQSGIGLCTYGSGGARCVATTTGTPVGAWIHIAGTLTMDNLCIYVAGIQEECASVSGNTASAAVPFTLGSLNENGAHSSYYDGMADEVRLSSVARYVGSFAPAENLTADENTIAMYHFNGGTGDMAADETGGNNLELHGGVSWESREDEPD